MVGLGQKVDRLCPTRVKTSDPIEAFDSKVHPVCVRVCVSIFLVYLVTCTYPVKD